MSQPDAPSPRLDRLSTQWTLIRRAGSGSLQAQQARRLLVLRYAPAARSYIRAITRSEELADELTQELVVRLLQGDFCQADPQRGRFRDFLKACVRNMIRAHYRSSGVRQAAPLPPQAASAQPAEPNDPWLALWRQRLLDVAWDALRHYQDQHPGNLFYTVLHMRAESPQMPLAQLAAELSSRLGRTVRPESFRQTLHRARALFARLLADEVAQGLDSPGEQQIEEELIALDLHRYVHGYLRGRPGR